MLLSHKKKLPFAATWMDPENIILSEVSQTKENIIWYHYVWNLKNNTGTPQRYNGRRCSHCRGDRVNPWSGA